jgi:hypothetical protein
MRATNNGKAEQKMDYWMNGIMDFWRHPGSRFVLVNPLLHTRVGESVAPGCSQLQSVAPNSFSTIHLSINPSIQS